MTKLDLRPPFCGLKQLPAAAFAGIHTPSYVIEEQQLRHNGEILAAVAKHTGCKILLAQKAFSCFDFYPILAPYIAGTEASGLFEARLGQEEMSEGEVHVFSAAYSEGEFTELLKYADHIVFNSPGQLARFGKAAKNAKKSIGLRINPEFSTQTGHEAYDPCAHGSRLGTTREQWDGQMTPELTALLDGIHFHTLCEQNSDALESTLNAVRKKFGDILPRMKWVNFGGGHHVTRPDYDIERLESCIKRAVSDWNVTVYLEPGEACALNAGYLVTSVLDVIHSNGIVNIILDMSAACHTPDVLEMPYRPPLYGAGDAGEKTFTARLAGPSCLAGDIIGDYSFDTLPQAGALLAFGDMAIYSVCKNNTFNGMPLPSIYARHEDGTLSLIRKFGYSDFKQRLGRASGLD